MSVLEFKNDIADPAALTTLSVDIATAGGAGEKSVTLAGTPGKTYKAASNPGVDSIIVSFTDPAGGLSASDIKLATTQGGLAAAAAGGTLDLGPQIVIAADNTGHPEIWVQITDTIGAGTHAGLSLSVVNLLATDT